jgi:hypothetical protein
MVAILNTCLTLKKLCSAHSEVVCFRVGVWFIEQLLLIHTPYIIGLITETQCVYCAV